MNDPEPPSRSSPRQRRGLLGVFRTILLLDYFLATLPDFISGEAVKLHAAHRLLESVEYAVARARLFIYDLEPLDRIRWCKTSITLRGPS